MSQNVNNSFTHFQTSAAYSFYQQNKATGQENRNNTLFQKTDLNENAQLSLAEFRNYLGNVSGGNLSRIDTTQLQELMTQMGGSASGVGRAEALKLLTYSDAATGNGDGFSNSQEMFTAIKGMLPNLQLTEGQLYTPLPQIYGYAPPLAPMAGYAPQNSRGYYQGNPLQQSWGASAYAARTTTSNYGGYTNYGQSATGMGQPTSKVNRFTSMNLGDLLSSATGMMADTTSMINTYKSYQQQQQMYQQQGYYGGYTNGYSANTYAPVGSYPASPYTLPQSGVGFW